jgi:virginiamycin B lyase
MPRPRTVTGRLLLGVFLALAAAGCAGANPSQPPSSAAASASAPVSTSTPAATGSPRTQPAASPGAVSIREFAVPAGSHPHDVAPAADGTVWYTAQSAGKLGRLDPETGQVREVALGGGSAPHGVIVGPDGAAWVTDSGLNAIVRVDAATHAVKRFPLPDKAAGANLNTATFDGRGALWFTGQGGWYGRVNVASGQVDAFNAPKGGGPYGIATAPDGSVAYSSLAGSYLGRIDSAAGGVAVVETPTARGGARRVWFDSTGRAWVTEWFAGKLAVYDASARSWREWRLPGSNPQPYAVFVDERDLVWITDFGSNAIVRFNPATERFDSFALPTAGASVRQLLGRPGEVWGAESGTDKLVVLRTGR